VATGAITARVTCARGKSLNLKSAGRLGLITASLLLSSTAWADSGLGTWDDPVVRNARGITSGNDLYHYCSMPNSTPPKVACVMFVQGVANTYRALLDRKVVLPIICPKKDWSMAAMMYIFMSYATKNLTKLDVSPAEALIAAWVDDSPCDSK
jgi:hypothetical protein